MAALQDLGTELVMLNIDQLAQIELPERLREAITSRHSASATSKDAAARCSLSAS